MRNTLGVLLIAAATIGPASCGPDRGGPGDGAGRDADPETGPEARPVVAATLPPIADLVEVVGGEAVQVTTLLPPGAHPDTYEATPRIARLLATADLVVRVGAAADAWLGPVENVPELVLTDGMRLHGQHGPGTGNPHVWLDPIRVRDRLLPEIADALTDVAPEAAPSIRQRAAAFTDSLTALDAEIRERLSAVEGRRFVAAHPAWIYFAERYGLDQVGAIHASPGAELGSRDLARLVDETRALGVEAVIAEPQLGSAGVDALADELGVRVEVADAVGGSGIEGREDYLSLMRFNARAFTRALGGER
ncbi:MAG: metal ABC transporter substrate-binding protein [Candidatus Longimicrobiales bacterium M2_2A_002]